MPRVHDLLDRLTQPSRSRHAGAIVMFGSPSPLDRFVSSAYFAVAARQWGRYGDDPHHLRSYEVGLASCSEPRHLLDLGTGTGGSAALAAIRWPKAEVVGLDASRAMLRLARTRHAMPNLVFQRGSLLRLPLPTASFELVTMLNAIPELGELRRVTAPDGEVLVANTTHPPHDPTSPWVARWREMGFVAEANGLVDDGSWERYRRLP